MIRKILLTLLLTVGVSQSLHANMPTGMPDMNMAMADMRKGMAILPFLTAHIENNEKLTSKDVELFLDAVKKKDSHYGKYSDGIEKGYEKAAQVLKPGVSFDTFATKSIELSGIKNELDKEAKLVGYADALDLTLKSTRIMRAMMAVEMEKEIAKAPKGQQAMMRSMLSGMTGKSNPEDIETLKPYADQLKQMMGQ